MRTQRGFGRRCPWDSGAPSQGLTQILHGAVKKGGGGGNEKKKGKQKPIDPPSQGLRAEGGHRAHIAAGTPVHSAPHDLEGPHHHKWYASPSQPSTDL